MLGDEILNRLGITHNVAMNEKTREREMDEKEGG